MTMEFGRRTVLGAGLAGGVTLLSGCDVSDIPKDPRRLVIALPQEMSVLDPSATLSMVDLACSQAAYQRLLAPIVHNGRFAGITGDLAERWVWAPDKSSVTFYLKPGNRFDDGSEVTSAAVAFSLDRIVKQKKTASQALFWLAGLDTPDAYTVRMKASIFLPFIEHMLWHPGLSIVNPKVVDQAVSGDQGSAWLRDNTAGSGSYRVSAFQSRAAVELKSNPHALLKPRYFETVDIRTVRDENSRSMQIASGDVDIVESVRTFQGKWLRKQPGIETPIGPAPQVLFLYLNTKARILRDVRVREAISLAIDRQRLLDTVYGKEGELLNGLIPTGVPGHDSTIPVSRHDPDAARALLKEAGIKAGTKLTITAVTDSGNPSTTTLAIQDFLSKIGLNIEIRQISSSARSQLVAGDFDMSVQALSIDFPDPWLMFNFAFNSASIGATNYAQYANAELDKLTMQADQREGTAREAMYQEAQRMVLSDVPVVPLLQMFGSYAKRKDVQNPNYNFAMPVIHDFKTMYRTSN